MKKGLLSLFVVALTIVSCAKNYDSKFEELTKLVTTLGTQVAGITEVKTQVTALQTTIAGLNTAIKAVDTNVNGNITKLSTDLAAVKISVTALDTKLADVASATELTKIQAELTKITESVAEILKSNSVVNQSITISSEATLKLAESLVGTRTDTPAKIVNGTITIDSKFADTNAAFNTRLEAVTNRIASVVAPATGGGMKITSTASSTVVFNNLTFINGTLEVVGSPFGHPKLTGVSGKLTIGHSKAVDYSLSTSLGDVELSKGITSVNFGTATIKSITTTGSATNNVYAPNATSFIAGTSKVLNANLPKATTVTLGSLDQTEAIILAGASKSVITFNGKTITGVLTVNGATDSTFNAPNLTSITGFTTINPIASVTFPKLTTLAGASVSATVINVPELTAATANITAGGVVVLNAPKLVVTNSLTMNEATTITVKSASNTNLTAPKATTLTLLNQGTKTNFDSSGYANLVTLNVTGAAGKSPFTTEVSNTITAGGPALVTVNVIGDTSDIGTLAVTGPDVTTVNTAGDIVAISLTGADIATANLLHAHVTGGTVASIHVVGTKLAALTTTNLSYVGTITITGNSKLASLNLASIKNAPFLGTYDVNIHTNKLTGTYVPAVARSGSTPYSEAEIKSNDLNSLTAMFTSSVSSTTGSYNIIKIDLSDTRTTTGDQTLIAQIDTNKDAHDIAGPGVLSHATNAYRAGTGISTAAQFIALVKPE